MEAHKHAGVLHRWHTHRTLIAATITLSLIMAVAALAAPSESRADMCTMVPEWCTDPTPTPTPNAPANPTHPSGTYKGYAYVRGLGICAAGATCVWAGELKVPSWRWSGTAWSKVEIASGTKVYVYPFSGNWRWVWISATGWTALYYDRILLGTDSCWDYTTWKYTCTTGGIYDPFA